MDPSKGYNRRARKLLHMTGGLPALLLPFIPMELAVAGALAGVGLTFVIKPQLAQWLRYVSKPVDRRQGIITGFTSYSLAVLTLILAWVVFSRFSEHAVQFTMFGWLTLAFGDGLAGLVGPSPRTAPTVPWNKNKTIGGAIGCMAGALIALWLSFMLPWPGAGVFNIGLPTAAILAATAMVLESLPIKLDDNYTVGLGSALAAFFVISTFNGGI